MIVFLKNGDGFKQLKLIQGKEMDVESTDVNKKVLDDDGLVHGGSRSIAFIGNPKAFVRLFLHYLNDIKIMQSNNRWISFIFIFENILKWHYKPLSSCLITRPFRLMVIIFPHVGKPKSMLLHCLYKPNFNPIFNHLLDLD